MRWVFGLLARLVGHPYFNIFMSIAMLTIRLVRLIDPVPAKVIRHGVDA